MITLSNVRKHYVTKSGVNHVLRGVSLDIQRGQRVGILGRNGGGKTTLARIISGADRSYSGSVIRRMSVSWPIGMSGAVHGRLSGIDNARFLSRVYGAKISEVLGFVEQFSEIGGYMREPVRTYSSGMRAKFSFAISLAISFDCYLVDEVISVGDVRFRKKCKEAILQSNSGLVLISHSKRLIQEYCDSAVVLAEGVAYRFDKVQDAVDFHETRLETA
jgi:capsular polysaccharide transport system ATP-binding protein